MKLIIEKLSIEGIHTHGRPAIGSYWEGQGGIYAGDFRAGDGSVYGLIFGQGQDIGRAAWGPNGERDLSDWDGLSNTQRLRNECAAAKLAAGYERDGHSDFYLPARRELLLGAANLHDTFGKESWYWTSTPRGEHYAWAVDFEYGFTTNRPRATSSESAPSADSFIDPFTPSSTSSRSIQCPLKPKSASRPSANSGPNRAASTSARV